MIDGGLRGIFRSHLPELHWNSIETGLTGSGIPDSEYCGRGVAGWIEYKVTDNFKVKVTPKTKFQIAWHERRAREGGRSFIAVRRHHSGGPRRGAPVDELYVYHGRDVRRVFEEGLRFLPVLFLSGGPARWSWDAIRKLILTEDK